MNNQKRLLTTYSAVKSHVRSSFKLVGVYSSIINILMLTGPIFMLQVYDRVLSSGSSSTLLGLFFIVVVSYGFMTIFDITRNMILSRVGYKFDTLVSPSAYLLSMKESYGEYEKLKPLNDIATIRGFISSPIMATIFDVPWIPIYLMIVFMFHSWLGWLTVVGALIIALLAYINQSITKTVTEKAALMDINESSFLEQSYKNKYTLRSLGMIERMSVRWRKMREEGLATTQNGQETMLVFSSVSKKFRMLLQSALLGLGAYLTLRQEISPGMIIATSIISGRALAPIDQIIAQWKVVVKAKMADKRLNTIFELEQSVPTLLMELPEPTGKLLLNGIAKYIRNKKENENIAIIDNVSFELNPGDGLGVIGPSASGKSTLARLIIGAESPDRGEVCLDGVSMKQYKPENGYIGYLPQKVELLPGTIRDNICRFLEEASDEAIVEAASLAGVHEMIVGFSEGYNTVVGYNDSNLSGGQIQRIGLARAVFGKPKYVVLDEPNSNLDVEGDSALTRAISGLRDSGITVIVMTHRPSAIASVNKILVLNHGRIVQFGDKVEILKNMNIEKISVEEK